MIFLKNLYTLVHKDANMFSIVLSDQEHPVFKAHFPGRPILPGFILLDIIAMVLKEEIVSIKKAKFLFVIEPKSSLNFYIEKKDKIVKVLVRKNEQKVADILYEKR